MDDLPERIWATLDVGQGGNFLGTCWLQGGERETEYLRADHVAALLAEERRKALEEAGAKVESLWAFRTCQEVADAIRALSDAPALRCAECDCEKGGEDCNWIAAGPAPAREVTVREAAKVLLEAWLNGAFEDTADAAADDAITDQWAHVDRTFPDANPIVEAWLRALSQGGEG